MANVAYDASWRVCCAEPGVDGRARAGGPGGLSLRSDPEPDGRADGGRDPEPGRRAGGGRAGYGLEDQFRSRRLSASSPSPAQPRLECPSQADPSTQTNAAGVVPAGTTGYHIKGRVTGTGGTPNLGDAQVLAYVHPAGTYAGYTNTAADGTYSVALPAGTYVLYFYDESLTYLHGYYESGSSGNFTIDYDSATR